VWWAAAVLGLAAAGAATLPGERIGLGVSVVGVVVCLLGALAAPLADRAALAWWIGAALLAAVPALRAAAWVAVPSLFAAASLASLGAAGGRTWREVGAGSVAGVLRVPAGVLVAPVALARCAAGRKAADLAPAARGAVLAAVLLGIFVPLLVAADAAFARLAEEAVDFEVSHPFLRAVAALLIAGATGGLALAARARRARPARASRAWLGATEWAIALAVLDLLFAGFVLLQLTTLFAGHDYVLRTTGLTYAEYARQGFAELLAVAALTLAVVAAAPSRDRLPRILLGALCVLTLIVLASAIKRLELYEEAFGFTRLRLIAHAALLWLGALVVAVLAAGAARRTAWLPRAVVAVSAAAVLLLALANPDRWIAEHNIDRLQRTGQLDEYYLTELSADATPALARLPRTLAACTTHGVRRRLLNRDGWAGLNLGRARARRALETIPAVVPTCPGWP
jgi:hypothetical protein